MKRQKPTTLRLGIISEGTLRSEDLLDSYLSLVEGLRLSKSERTTVRRIQAAVSSDRYTEDAGGEEISFDLDDLVVIIENHLPDYSYFGSHEGDGACIGIWPSIDSLEEDARFGDNGVAKCADSAFPVYAKDGVRANYIMQVSDHGNVSLHRRAGNRWIEVWSVV